MNDEKKQPNFVKKFYKEESEEDIIMPFDKGNFFLFVTIIFLVNKTILYHQIYQYL